MGAISVEDLQSEIANLRNRVDTLADRTPEKKPWYKEAGHAALIDLPPPCQARLRCARLRLFERSVSEPDADHAGGPTTYERSDPLSPVAEGGLT